MSVLSDLESDAPQLERSMEPGSRPGSRGMLLFGKMDPGGSSIAQVTVSIKHQTWPAAPFRC